VDGLVGWRGGGVVRWWGGGVVGGWSKGGGDGVGNGEWGMDGGWGMGKGKVKGDGEFVSELGAMGLVEKLLSTYNGWRRIRGSECQFDTKLRILCSLMILLCQSGRSEQWHPKCHL